MLSVLFIVLASTALVAALAALFASLRASLAGPTDETRWASAGPDRGALEDEKNALLRALKDLEYEHEVGKIDDEDYGRLERAYRARAKDVLGELDRDLRPYLSRAEALASGVDASDRKKAKKKKKKDEDDAKSEPETKSEPEVKSEPEAKSEAKSEPEHEVEAKSESEHETETQSEPETKSPVCPKCATVNDSDAAFCKKCATPLHAAEASS